jgi:arylsulfatase
MAVVTVSAMQRAHGLEVWEEPFVALRFPKLFTLRADPFERADHEGMDYRHWRVERMFALVPAQAYVMQWLQSFRDFPPRQEPASFGIDQVMERLTSGAGAARQ